MPPETMKRYRFVVSWPYPIFIINKFIEIRLPFLLLQLIPSWYLYPIRLMIASQLAVKSRRNNAMTIYFHKIFTGGNFNSLINGVFHAYCFRIVNVFYSGQSHIIAAF